MIVVSCLALVLASATLAPPATVDALQPIARITSIEGMPPDSSSRERFMRGFRATFAASELPAESGGDDAWSPAGGYANHFRLEGDTAVEDAWRVQIVLGIPPIVTAEPPKKRSASRQSGLPRTHLRRASRGLHVTALAWSAESERHGARPIPYSVGIAFPVNRPAGAEGDLLIPPGGYDYPWEAAGRAAAIVALEQLHHVSGNMPENERFVLAPALRMATGR